VYDAILAQTVNFAGAGGDVIEGYSAQVMDHGPRGGVVVIHHMPGYDAGNKEIARTLAVNGFNAVVPNLYWREAPGASPDDAAAISRSAGGVPDDRLVGDVAGAAEYLKRLSNSNGRVGVIGFCSGGRQSFLAACRLPLQAAVVCYGAFILTSPPSEMPMKLAPLAPEAGGISCPVLGLFGDEDRFPAPEEVAELDRLLTSLNKEHEFTSYPGAGHAFFNVSRPSYRPEAAMDGWEKIVQFYRKHLG
jgi:carboxymethylenebutenolidase